jgi:hypothetical protein
MWRTTPLHRREARGSLVDDAGPELPAQIDRTELQPAEAGVGPLFHRRYVTRIREARLSAHELMARVMADPDSASPKEFATFRKTRGKGGGMRVGDEYVVRMPGPWDGPVRVIEVTDASLRLATLAGHLEAGQIEFAAVERDGQIEFRIESWARSRNRLVDVLYSHLRMAKEVQFHMWTSYLERVTRLAEGRMSGGIDIQTRRVDELARES